MRRRRRDSKRSIRERFILIGELYRVDNQQILLSGRSVPEIGERVYNSRLREAGYVSDVFGRVDDFYILIKLRNNIGENSPGEKERFYVLRKEME